MRDLIPRLKARAGAGHRRVSAQQDRAVKTRPSAELVRPIRIVRRQRRRGGGGADRSPAGARSRDRSRRVARSSTRVRRDGDRGGAGVRAQVRPPGRRRSRSPRAEIETARADGAAGSAARDPRSPRHIRARRAAADARRRGRSAPAPGRAHRAAGHAARSRRLLRARRTLSAALLSADDRDSGARRRRARGHRRLSAARSDGHVRGARGRGVTGCSGSAARTRSRRWRTAPATIPRVDKIVGPGNAYVAAAKALVAADCAIDFFAGPSEIAVVSTTGNAGMDCRRSDRAGRARSRRARDPDHAVAKRLARAVARAIARQMPADGPAADRARAQRRHRRHRARLDEAIALCPAAGARARRLRPDAVAARLTRAGHGVRRRLQRAGVRRLRDRLEPRAADQRRGRGARRPERRRLRARVVGAADRPRPACERIAPAGVALAEAEGLTAHAASMRIRLAAAFRRSGRHADGAPVTSDDGDESPIRAAAGAGRRAAAAPQREHRRLLPGGASRRSAA